MGAAVCTSKAPRSDATANGQGPPRTIIIFFGPPGAGKGTHAPTVVDALGTPQLSTGDMLRAAVREGSEVGKKADAIMQAGGLVPDDIVVSAVRERISQSDCRRGFILDGFPRTIDQAKQLDRLLADQGERVSLVLALQVPDDVLEARITGRWIHPPSGRSYHVANKRPKSLPPGVDPTPDNMLDDDTGEQLIQRKDDTKEALKSRLEAYHEVTTPLLDHYKDVVVAIDANKPVADIPPQILAAIAPFPKAQS